MNIRLTGIVLGIVFVIFGLAASIAVGKSMVPLHTVIDAFTSFDGSREHLIIRTVRVPRALMAMMVGASLGMAGSIMQAISRNPLAGPEMLGSNYGAALLLVISMFVFGFTSSLIHMWAALLGAGLACLVVFMLGSLGRGGLTSIKLILAGATINMLLASMVQGILIFSEESLDEMRFWMAGSLTGGSMEMFVRVLPYMLVGMAGALVLSRQINLLSLGDEVAQGLGLKIGLMKTAALFIVMCLMGGSVAIAGPIGFIGLAVPHIVRFMVGLDYRWIIPYSALLGAGLLLLADIAARFIFPYQELPAGVVTAMAGAPFLIYLAQRREKR
ncbi:iron complex transport system permease protein [Paenibacillus algorifonticola]|uniref:Iron complex transport system permease protein n=1 Tax=Paenibacillus algorifonticola TaxID=684063 RepID=A0A1I2GI53_9BACL|nr:iron ABC transporter permease [Paenibacillus algorifonticola]SFF17152.1 iron complex transport system permease protein [Paenibacillus algorifonticola]